MGVAGLTKEELQRVLQEIEEAQQAAGMGSPFDPLTQMQKQAQQEQQEAEEAQGRGMSGLWDKLMDKIFPKKAPVDPSKIGKAEAETPVFNPKKQSRKPRQKQQPKLKYYTKADLARATSGKDLLAKVQTNSGIGINSDKSQATWKTWRPDNSKLIIAVDKKNVISLDMKLKKKDFNKALSKDPKQAKKQIDEYFSLMKDKLMQSWIKAKNDPNCPWTKSQIDKFYNKAYEKISKAHLSANLAIDPKAIDKFKEQQKLKDIKRKQQLEKEAKKKNKPKLSKKEKEKLQSGGFIGQPSGELDEQQDLDAPDTKKTSAKRVEAAKKALEDKKDAQNIKKQATVKTIKDKKQEAASKKKRPVKTIKTKKAESKKTTKGKTKTANKPKARVH